MSFIVCFGATNEETPWVRLSCTASNVLQVVRATSGMRAGSTCVPNPSCQRLHEEDTDRLRINCNQQASCGTPVGEASQPPCTGGTADYLVVEYECLTGKRGICHHYVGRSPSPPPLCGSLRGVAQSISVDLKASFTSPHSSGYFWFWQPITSSVRDLPPASQKLCYINCRTQKVILNTEFC